MIVPFFGLATLWATFSKIWAIFSNLLVTLLLFEKGRPYPQTIDQAVKAFKEHTLAFMFTDQGKTFCNIDEMEQRIFV